MSFFRGANVGPVNNVLHSLITNVDIFINETAASSQNSLYAYKSYLEELLDVSCKVNLGHKVYGSSIILFPLDSSIVQI